MLSDDAVEDGACLTRNSLHSGLEDIQIKFIRKHARRQGVPFLSCASNGFQSNIKKLVLTSLFKYPLS